MVSMFSYAVTPQMNGESTFNCDEIPAGKSQATIPWDPFMKLFDLAVSEFSDTASCVTSDDDASDSSENQVKSVVLYKTEMCESFLQTANCRYGKKCKFAHGVNELRTITRHPKYKTEICRNYLETNSCPYGKRCCFLHKRKEELFGSDLAISAATPTINKTTPFLSKNTTPSFNPFADLSPSIISIPEMDFEDSCSDSSGDLSLV